MSDKARCELCGEPMPPGEEVFKYHGYSGPCPRSPLERVAKTEVRPVAERWVQGHGRLWFGRCADGTVLVALMKDDRRPDDKEATAKYWVGIDDGIWASIVLTLTAFNERPNDWHAFLAHQNGREDLLAAAKNMQTIRNILSLDHCPEGLLAKVRSLAGPVELAADPDR